MWCSTYFMYHNTRKTSFTSVFSTLFTIGVNQCYYKPQRENVTHIYTYTGCKSMTHISTLMYVYPYFTIESHCNYIFCVLHTFLKSEDMFSKIIIIWWHYKILYLVKVKSQLHPQYLLTHLPTSLIFKRSILILDE